MIDIAELPARGRFTVDSAPIIYFLEGHSELAVRYAPLFERAEAGNHELVISTVALAEILTGPLRGRDEGLAAQYREALVPPTWRVAPLDAEIAHRAARIRARSGLRLPDAVQLATALETSSIGLVTHDRDFSPSRLASLTEGVPVYR